MTKSQEEKIDDQVKMMRMNSLCERRFFLSTNVEFMSGGWTSGG